MPLSRRAALKHLVAAGLGAVAGAAAHGFSYERHRLELTRAELSVSGLSPSHDGLRIGFVSDLHHSSFVSQSDVASAAELLVAERPDLIVLGGDYITNFDRRYAEPCAEALAALTAPHGVVAVLGNHDDEREVPAALRRQGFATLRDARTTLTIAGESLDLAGLRFWTRQPSELARVIRGARGTLVLLAHDPRRLLEAAALSVPAVLSGHTHGGQLVVPGMGAVAAARRFPVVAGLGSRDATSIFVSRGVGTVFLPIRINCPPEVAVVTLRPRVRFSSDPTVGSTPCPVG